MKSFPDEASLPKSSISGETIRGGSIGLNNILNRFVKHADIDRSPEFSGTIISAFTFFRNVMRMDKDGDIKVLEEAFLNEIRLFLEYYDIYLSQTKMSLDRVRKSPVVIYFPDYKHVERELLRDLKGEKAELFTRYNAFVKRYNGRDQMAMQLENCICYWVRAGDATYPHIEVARKFRDLASVSNSLYKPNDKIALITHIPLDFHISKRLRNIVRFKSYTGELETADDFKLLFDKEGRLPFNTAIHLTFGDSQMIKPWASPKAKREILEVAEKDRWLTKSEGDIRKHLAKIMDIPVTKFQKYDFI